MASGLIIGSMQAGAYKTKVDRIESQTDERNRRQDEKMDAIFEKLAELRQELRDIKSHL